MKKSYVVGIVIVLLVGGWFIFGSSDGNDGPVELGDALIPEPLFQETNLEAVGGYSGDGVAKNVYLPGSFTHTVVANIGDPAEGKFYEGWLVGGFGFVSTGKMVKEGNQYVLQFESQEDMSSYGKVVITEETLADGLDNNPEAHVLEGNF